ncbi:VOC family protein [Maritimibacter sp. DP1N21-5]|uniref:VOC family protein n=1 Tax=Maritimibacter sp. DP1N21-5 TaxID=2836867 RepID=UPI001C48F31C|nr:VOC family protein [Maritimibacter sp. DP1N21-5]MBV7408088.1 VOC family protein [Maritimibacter sp. DP1N21-5]
MKYSVTIDVPDLVAGIAFYTKVLSLREVARPVPVYAVLKGDGEQMLGLMEKPEGTAPAPGSDDRRRYGRHWTPVHLDIQVDDFEETLVRLVDLGGTLEQRFDMEERPPTAFCSDPFGNGFCLMKTR